MHTLIITPHVLHSTLLKNALDRQNIKSLSCSPQSLSKEWCPSTDAIVFPHALTKDHWDNLLPFLLNISTKLPLIFLTKIEPLFFEDKKFRSLARQAIFLDSTLSIDAIPLLIKDLIQKRPQTESKKELSIGHFTLDRNERSLKTKNYEASLTKKEFFLLELLVQNMGRVLSRELIIDQLWDKNTYIESNTVDVIVSRLRKKLQVKRTDPLIRTIPSLGYQLCEK